METKTVERLEYLDNVRTAVVILVVVVHAAVTFGSAGGWYYTHPTTDLTAIVPLSMISAVCQSFFMSLLFFVSAYFTERSIGRKGPGRFAVDRIRRLGPPLLLYAFAIGPLTDWVTFAYLYGNPYYSYRQSIHLGPLWFVQALLVFSLVYAAGNAIVRRRREPAAPRNIGVPNRAWFTALILALSVLTFLARWVFPMGTFVAGMQLGSFPHYIVSFALGIVAYRRGWLQHIGSLPIRTVGFASVSLITIFAAGFILGVGPDSGVNPFLGGTSWHAVFYAAWESAMCVVMSLLVLGIAYRRSQPDNAVWGNGSRLAFGVYVLHSFVLVVMTVGLVRVDAHPLILFLILAILGTAVSFIIAEGAKRVPVLRTVV